VGFSVGRFAQRLAAERARWLVLGHGHFSLMIRVR